MCLLAVHMQPGQIHEHVDDALAATVGAEVLKMREEDLCDKTGDVENCLC